MAAWKCLSHVSIDSGLLHRQIVPQAPTNTSGSSFNLAATIGRGTFFGIVAGLTQMSTRLVTVPIVIGYLGLDGYGIWSIIMAVAGYMRFGSAGVKSAFQKYVAEATGQADFQKVNKLLSTGTAAMLALSIVGLIPIAAFSHSLVRVMGVPDEFIESTAIAISLLAVIMVFSNVGTVYEAIVMGGHRIDLIRKFGTAFTILEAIAIVVFLYEGYGLVAMTAIMALSEVGYLLCCYFVSRRIVPAIQIATTHLSCSVLRELFSFAGSYQLVGILQVLYMAILPVSIMNVYGAKVAGVYAIASRLLGAALIAQEAFLLPVLSGGSLVYASGSVEKMRTFFAKSFRMTLALVVLPLAFMASNGTLIVFVWMGLVDPSLRMVVLLLSLSGLFNSLSRLAFILYRASGRAWMDNVRQVLLLVALLVILSFNHQLGLFGILGCVALVELMGTIFMFAAVARVFQGLSARMLVSDAVKLLTATVAIIFVGMIVVSVPIPWEASERLLAAFKLGALSMATLVVALPILLMSGSLKRSEVNLILHMRKANG